MRAIVEWLEWIWLEITNRVTCFLTGLDYNEILDEVEDDMIAEERLEDWKNKTRGK